MSFQDAGYIDPNGDSHDSDAASEAREQASRLNYAMQVNDEPFYAKFLGKRLTARCKQVARQQAEQQSLADELSLMRLLLGDAIQLYEATIDEAEKSGTQVGTVAHARIQYAASNVVMATLAQIRDMAVAHKKVSTTVGIDPVALQSVVLQVVQVIDGELRQHAGPLRMAGLDPREFVRTIESKISDGVALPRGFDGTSLTPAGRLDANGLLPADDEAMLMDGTVPAGPNNTTRVA